MAHFGPFLTQNGHFGAKMAHFGLFLQNIRAKPARPFILPYNIDKIAQF